MTNHFSSKINQLLKEATELFDGKQGKAMSFFAERLDLASSRQISRWKIGITPKDSDGILEIMTLALEEKRNGHVSNAKVPDLYKEVQELKALVHELAATVKSITKSPDNELKYGKEIYILNKVKIVEEDK